MYQKIKQWSQQHTTLLVWLSFFLLSIGSIYLIYLHNGQFLRGDDYRFHQNRIEGLAESLKHGIFFPKITYFFIGGYGYASSLFYPDIFLYFPALLRVFGWSLAASFISFMVLVNFVTFLLTYYSGRYLDLSKRMSYLFSLLYTLSIYRLQDMINRQAIGELLALIFFPLVLAGIYQIKKGNTGNWILLTIAMTGIGMAHFISLEMMSLFLLFYMLGNWRRFIQKDALLALTKAASMTILWLAFYLFPVAEQLLGQTFKVTASPLTFISDRSYPLQDLVSNSLKSSVFHASTGNIGTILFIGLLIYTVTLFKKQAKNKSLIVIAWLLFLLVTNLFPWQLFDYTPLNTIQFPWRFLSIISLIVAYLIASDELSLLNGRSWRLMLLISFIGVNVGYYELASLRTESDRILTYQKYNKPNSYYIGAGHEYLPEEVDYDRLLKHKQRQLTYKEQEITLKNQQIEFAEITFDYQAQKTTEVVLPLIYYKGYQAEITQDGQTKKQPVTMDAKTGFAKVTLSGKGKVTVHYRMTLIQKASMGLSIVAVIGYGYYRKRKK